MEEDDNGNLTLREEPLLLIREAYHPVRLAASQALTSRYWVGRTRFEQGGFSVSNHESVSMQPSRP
jgi:hypothetical protein